MARLKVKLKGKLISEMPLSDGRIYVAGRKEDCDLVLQAEKGISREHFKIEPVNGTWRLEVLSRFGNVTLAGEVINQTTLEHGSVFLVPPYEFEFVSTSSDVISQSEVGAEAEDFDEKTAVGVIPAIPYIKVINADQQEIEVFRLEGGDAWVAGRDPHGSIIIRDMKVSRKQFEIRKISSQFYIQDLGSVNGTILNNVPLSDQPTPLKSGDAISVLTNNMVFELRDPNYSKKLELVQMTQQQDIYDSQAQHYDPPSIVTSQAPMPYDPGQYPAGFTPQFPQASPQKAGFDFEKNRPKLILGAVVLLLGLYLFVDESGTGSSSNPQTAGPVDPLAKLSPEEQVLIRQSYELAKNYYTSGKYELANQEIQKVIEKAPNYQDASQIARLSNEAIRSLEMKRRNDQLEADRQRAEQEILKQTEICEKQMNPNITMSQFESCIESVIAYNPEHPRILSLRQQVEMYTEERAAKEAQQAQYQERVDQLTGLYRSATSLERDGNRLGAIAAYNRVATSSLPDPQNLKGKSRSKITALKKEISSKTAIFEDEAIKFYQAGNLKNAILSVRKAMKVDPTNTDLKERERLYISELRKQMMVLYQEGILEESFGNVDGGETRAGAKEKWKKILQLDVPDGEYYKKAYIKLKKYGAL